VFIAIEAPRLPSTNSASIGPLSTHYITRPNQFGAGLLAEAFGSWSGRRWRWTCRSWGRWVRLWWWTWNRVRPFPLGQGRWSRRLSNTPVSMSRICY